jgi:cytochrome c553
MRHLIRATMLGAVASGVCVIVVAETSSDQGVNQGSVGRGARIAAWGTSRGVASCSSCHGYDGVGNGNNRVPRLAGLSSAYLFRQLNDFAGGSRTNAYMANFAQRLSVQERADVAAYYASLRSSFPPVQKEFTAALLERGHQLAVRGDDKLTLQSCNNCHGPQGEGESPNIPALQGQYSNYIIERLQDWKQTTQGAASQQALNALMERVASNLGQEDMQAVGAYFEQLSHNGSQATK